MGEGPAGPLLARRLLRALMPCLGPAVSSFRPGLFDAPDWLLVDGGDPALAPLGIKMLGGRCRVALRSLSGVLGNVRITAVGEDALLVIDNSGWSGTLNLNLRLRGDRCTAVFCNLHGVIANLSNVFLRSAEEIVFWGYGASAVGAAIEMEGGGRRVVVGDDALISSGVWIRNFDMHGINDLRDDRQINAPCDTILEQHVWLGQDALLLNCPYVGGGSIVGARALVKDVVERMVVVGGLPARVLRRDTSWGRAVATLSAKERNLIAALRSLPPALPRQPH